MTVHDVIIILLTVSGGALGGAWLGHKAASWWYIDRKNAAYPELRRKP